MRRKALLVGLLVAGIASASALAVGTAATGPSSSQAPYAIPSQDGVITKSILTVGDFVDGYRMVGIPDGLGANESRPGTFTLLANHELGQDGRHRPRSRRDRRVRVALGDRPEGLFRGRLGAVTRSPRVATWNTTTPAKHNAPAKGVALGRLCSAHLAPLSAYYDKKFRHRLQAAALPQSARSVGAEGPRVAHPEGGISWELPALGKFGGENAVANPADRPRHDRGRHRRPTPGPGVRLRGREEGDGQSR